MEEMGSGAQSARLYRQDKIGTDDLRDVVAWRGVGRLREDSCYYYRGRARFIEGRCGEATTLGSSSWLKGQPVPKATPVSLFSLTIHFIRLKHFILYFESLSDKARL